MKRPPTFKIIAVFAACISGAVFANMNDTQPANPTVSTPALHVPDDRPNVPVGSRGQLLYENHCIACHDSRIHIRDKRKSRSVSDIEKWVIHWSQYLKLDWKRAEINEVTEHLNQQYYQFPYEKN